MRNSWILLAISLALPAAPVLGDAPIDEYTLTIKDHKFSPPELVIPADRKVKLLVVNADPTPEEFESHELNREKVIPGNSSTKIFVGPLAPGVYPFFGEFNQATAQGKLVVK